MRKLIFLRLLGLLNAGSGSGSGEGSSDFEPSAEKCLICEFVGVADSEYDALGMLAGNNATYYRN